MDPFSTKNVFKIETRDDHQSEDWHGFKLDTELQSDSLRLAEFESIKIPTLHSDVLKLSLDNISLEAVDISDAASESSDIEKDPVPNGKIENVDLDIWDATFLSRKTSKNHLLSWDLFRESTTHHASPIYLSEAGRSVYDCVTSRAWYSEHQQALQFARPDLFQRAVLNVLLGRSSLLFEWNNTSSSFETQFDNFTLPGYSPELTDALCRTFCACGTSFRTVRTFCDSPKVKDATTFAVQSSLAEILNSVEVDVQQTEVDSLTPIRLRKICNKHAEVYEIVTTIVTIVQGSDNEPHIIKASIEYLDETWFSKPPLQAMLTYLADRILQPAIRDTCQRIGPTTISSGATTEDVWQLAGLLPGCERSFQEIVQCLHVGQNKNVQARSFAVDTGTMKLVSKWSELPHVQQEADIMEAEARTALMRSLSISDPCLYDQQPISGPANENESNPFNTNFKIPPIENGVFHEHTSSDSCIQNLMVSTFRDEMTDAEPNLSPMQMLEMSVSPILSARQRLCSYDLLKMLFLKYDLVAHLEMLYSFHLMGDRSFTARLSKALFDADQYSAEGLRKNGLNAGLRLEDREVWPPASSELRLVLMGLLTDSPTISRSQNRLECLSFAIRELPDEELERCRDMHSIHALDFLRLHYAPPDSTLDLILSTSTLDKYDRIFQFLLVLLRLHAFTQNLVTAVTSRKATASPNLFNHRFCLEIHHFVTSFFDYALNVAISMPFRKMFRYFEQVRDAVLAEDYNGCMSLAGSIKQLGKTHEDTLDETLAALFLKDEQTQLFTATCDIFSIGLRSVEDQTGDVEQESRTRHQELCHALNDWYSQVYKTIRQGRGLRTLEYLLVTIDYSRYYEKGAQNPVAAAGRS